MASTDQIPLRGVELRDRAFMRLRNASVPSDDLVQDVDARKLALLGKKQRLQVGFRRSMNASDSISD